MRVTIVGAGPGDPELITVKGMKCLQKADVILYTDSLVDERLVESFNTEGEIVKTSGMHLDEIVELMAARAAEGKHVVRLHTGDPAMFGAIYEQMKLLEQQQVEVEIIPGVSSVFAAAASLNAELTIPELTQTVILTRAEGRTPVPERERLELLASHHCTIALFLSATLAKKITNSFLEAGWDENTPCAVVYKATWPDEKIVRTTIGQLSEAMRENGIRKHAMILAGWALEPSGDYRSKLYDRAFTHGYRQGSGS